MSLGVEDRPILSGPRGEGLGLESWSRTETNIVRCKGECSVRSRVEVRENLREKGEGLGVTKDRSAEVRAENSRTESRIRLRTLLKRDRSGGNFES